MNHESLNKQGVELVKKNLFSDAKYSFKQALILYPDYTDALNNLGSLHHTLGDLDQAVRLFKRVVVLDPNYALKSDNKIDQIINKFKSENTNISFFEAKTNW